PRTRLLPTGVRLSCPTTLPFCRNGKSGRSARVVCASRRNPAWCTGGAHASLNIQTRDLSLARAKHCNGRSCTSRYTGAAQQITCMNSINGLTDDQQVEFDQLTQEQGDDLYLAPTQASHSSSSDPAPSRCCTTISTQHQHWRHEGRRQPQRQASARCASSSGSAGSVACHHNNHQGTPAAHHGHGRGQGPGRGYHQHYRNQQHRGDTGDGHRSGLPPTRAGGRLLRRRDPSAGAASGAARAEARAEQNLDMMIKDALGVALREHLCADNSERYRLTPGSYRVPAVPEEARSAAADAALAARGDKLPPSPPLPLPPIALVSGSDSSSGWGYGGGASSTCASASGSGSAIEATTGCRDGGDGVGDGCGSG
ncbi:unnamed protein product, partial [Ectocarpus sp. 4 AP-2014]